MNEPKLPIKVVFPSKKDFVKPPPGGKDWPPFVTVDDTLRKSFATQIDKVMSFFKEPFQSLAGLPAVAKVTLREQALAKTYRPTELFNENTCPIIGGNKFGELYIGVRPEGLRRIGDMVRRDTGKEVVKSISTIQEIQPYRKEDVITNEEATANALKVKKKRIRVRLFRHASEQVNQVIDSTFKQLAEDAGAEDITEVVYAEGIKVYSVSNLAPQKLFSLASFIGTQSISPFPTYKIVRTAAHAKGALTATHFPPPAKGVDYGTVLLFDSGTDPSNSHLQAWVLDRYNYVPRAMQNNEHGSFVAGLLINPRSLNNGDERFPSASSRIIDVVIFDKEETIEERDLIDAIDKGIKKYPNVKTANLSISLSSEPCADSEFSIIGAALDERTKKHGVLFVVAAGNFRDRPYRSWPPDADHAEGDRICPPADSIAAITVGSIAHLDSPRTRVRRDEPSPFTRRGPGPAYILKPELSYFGGNCDDKGGYVQTGVLSIDGKSNLAESAGTSYATPLVSNIAANVYDAIKINGKPPTPALVKGLLVHSALLRNAPLDTEMVKYVGLGIPADVEDVVKCWQSSATMILQVPITPNPDFVKKPFPMPRCLVNSKGQLRAEIFMTLLYDPPLDRKFKSEYCRCNIKATLGTFEHDPASNSDDYGRQVHPVPKSLSEGYEKDLIKHGYKWSPMKLYHRKMTRMEANKDWRLSIDMLARDETVVAPVDVTLIITINALPDENGELTAPVYDELVREMTRLNWVTQDLQVQRRIRVV